MSEQPRSVVTSVAIDVGDGYGALIVRTDMALEGHEIEIENERGERLHAVANLIAQGTSKVPWLSFPRSSRGRIGSLAQMRCPGA